MAGSQVSTERDSLEALANFKAGKYGLIISDIRMPKMDGFELIDKLSMIDPNVKVCFHTAFDGVFRKVQAALPEHSHPLLHQKVNLDHGYDRGGEG